MTSNSSDDITSRTQQSPLASQREKQQHTRRSPFFPLGYKDAFTQWWAGLTPETTESRVLSYIPYLQKAASEITTSSAPSSTSPSATNLTNLATHSAEASIADPHGPRHYTTTSVSLSGQNRALHELHISRSSEPTTNHLVILHGYGAGLGFFYKNFEPLSRPAGWSLWALDLLGMGRSSRPPFRIHAKDREGKIREAENWFVDALEEWRANRGIERMTLLGHSLGGYMAVAYALKHPGRLNKLILASPVGIPEDPYAVNEDLPEPGESTVAEEFTQDSATAKEADRLARNGKNVKNGKKEPQRKPLPKWVTYLWDANVSPFSLVRMAGPFGPTLVSGWTSRRFSHLPPAEAQALHDYAYSLFRQRGSGEYALAYILAPGAFARDPLIRRIAGVGRQMVRDREGGPPKRERAFPVVLMYGEHDWMDVAGGMAAEWKINEEKRRLVNEEKIEGDQGGAKLMVVKGAGHHLYLEGPEEFNEYLLKEMDDVRRIEGKWRREDEKLSAGL